MADNGDRRMHEGRKPGLDESRGHERHETPLTDADRIGREDDATGQADTRGAEQGGSTLDREQESALGGDVATRSGRAPTAEELRSS